MYSMTSLEAFEFVEEGVREWIDSDELVITPLRKRKTDIKDDPYPYYVIHLPSDYDTRKLLKFKTVLDFKVRWEKLSTKDRTAQCHRCQKYGHGSDYCTYTPRCVKCVGEHLTQDCPKGNDRQTEAQCINCNGHHPANHRKCPAYREYKDKLSKEKEARTSRQTTIRNVRQPTNPREITRLATRATGRSYAEATAQPYTEPTGSRPPNQPPRAQPNRGPTTSHTSGQFSQNTNASDFQQLAHELKKLNEVCDIRSMLLMVKELNKRIHKDMDNLTKLQIMLDITQQTSYE